MPICVRLNPYIFLSNKSSQSKHQQRFMAKKCYVCHHGNGFSEVSEKTLCIIGYGDLGQAIANFQSIKDITERSKWNI
jgi:phosphoglycerate dehydrogenase-like enzyme